MLWRNLAVLASLALATSAVSSAGNSSPSPTRFLNAKTKKYLVTSLPVVSEEFDVGELYAGEIPVGDDLEQTLFYVFEPTPGAPVDEITIWLNGGPGCSSLEGWLQENGRFLWQPGTYRPVENPYAWSNQTNMLWVDQPEPVGFSQGPNNVTTEQQMGKNFVSWFSNFQKTFGIENYKIYITGESYAGVYVPVIAAAMLQQNNTKYYDVQGALTYDACIGDYDLGNMINSIAQIAAYNNVLNVDPDTLSASLAADKSCSFADFRETYLSFPPPRTQPHPEYNHSCYNAVYQAFRAIERANPCFNSYHFTDACPTPWNVLTPTGGDPGYLNRKDVKEALHVPASAHWAECKTIPVRPPAILPTLHDIPYILEKTNRFLVGNGDLDLVILTNSTLLSIQNMTWGGKLGFQTKPSTPINLSLTGYAGVQHQERGLLWSEAFNSGHMEPQYQPELAYRHLLWLRRKIESL